ncbi:MAG: glycosyltransferase family 4 protein [Bacteroidales bacterium]|nr:glycosyltransferase family 4 protein [Bacteroidales bacterium]
MDTNLDFKIKNRGQVFKILVPARIDPKKNQVLVVKALRDLSDIEIHFAGKVDVKKYFDLLLKEIGGNNIFVLDGYVPKIRNYYREFDLVLLPSLEEGTSNVILECLADGIPCMVSNISMNVRLQQSSMFVFESNNAKDLQLKVGDYMKKSASDIEQVLIAGRLFVANNYSVEKMIEKYFSLFQ